jgi:hypothetical protein
MRVIKLIGPAAMIAALAMFAPHADAQTMGEYATTVGVASGGGSSMGTSIDNSLSGGDLGGSRTWGASSLGASFDERAGAASGSGAVADFNSRAASMTGGSAADARWPAQSGLSNSDTSKRFSSDTGSDRWSQTDRFPSRGQLSSPSSDRFPPSAFNDNRMGLDTHFASSSGLDTSYSSK